MSFSFSYAAESKKAALAKLETEYAPDSVKEFIRTAIENLREPKDKTWRLGVDVKATGHLCDGPTSYEATNCDVKVSPLYLATEPAAT